MPSRVIGLNLTKHGAKTRQKLQSHKTWIQAEPKAPISQNLDQANPSQLWEFASSSSTLSALKTNSWGEIETKCYKYFCFLVSKYQMKGEMRCISSLTNICYITWQHSTAVKTAFKITATKQVLNIEHAIFVNKS